MSDVELVAVPLDELKDLVEVCLIKIGLEGFEADIVRDVLMYAQLRDNNQGLVKIVEGTVTPPGEASQVGVVSSHGATLRLNGNQCSGMVVSYMATEEAIRIAGEFGIAFVGTCNTSTSTGAIGYYAEKMAAEGYIGIVLAGSPKVMAIAGGIDPVFGTNPIAIAVPTDTDPLVLDMATAAMAWFGLIEARNRNEFLPIGVAVDSSGQATTDPATALDGAIMPFGEHKGSGLAMMIELLTGPLVGAGIFGDEDAATNRGMAFIAIQPSALGPEGAFKNAVSTLKTRLKESRRQEGVDEIRLPGESARRKAEEAIASGSAKLPKALYDRLQEIGRSG